MRWPNEEYADVSIITFVLILVLTALQYYAEQQCPEKGKRSQQSAVDNLSFRLQGTLWRKPRKLVYCVTLIIIVCSHVGQALSNGRALHCVRSHGDCQPGDDSLAASTSRMSLGASGPVSGSWAPVGRGAIPKRRACTAHGPHLQASIINDRLCESSKG